MKRLLVTEFINISYEADRGTTMEISLNFRQGKLYFHLPKVLDGPEAH